MHYVSAKYPFLIKIRTVIGALNFKHLLPGRIMKKKSVTKNLLSVAIGTLLASNISAQDNKLVFEEVLVTAEKRTESLQDLSQAITVLNGEDLDNRQI